MNKPADYSARLSEALKTAGYSVKSSSVNNKNQTRFIHLILDKNGEKFFAKANNKAATLLNLENEAISEHVKDGNMFSLVKPADKIVVDEQVSVYIYPFIDYPAISREEDGFKSFNLAKEDLESFFNALVQLLGSVSNSTMYSLHDISTLHTDSLLKKWLQAIDPSDTNSVMALQTLANTLPEVIETVPAVEDIQTQNLLWDSADKHLYLIDLEAVRNMPLFYDHAKLAVSLFSLCDQPDISHKWLVRVIKEIESAKEQSIEKLAQLHRMLLWSGLEYYIHFKKISDGKRQALALDYLRWVLHEFAPTVNKVS